MTTNPLDDWDRLGRFFFGNVHFWDSMRQSHNMYTFSFNVTWSMNHLQSQVNICHASSKVIPLQCWTLGCIDHLNSAGFCCPKSPEFKNFVEEPHGEVIFHWTRPFGRNAWTKLGPVAAWIWRVNVGKQHLNGWFRVLNSQSWTVSTSSSSRVWESLRQSFDFSFDAAQLMWSKGSFSTGHQLRVFHRVSAVYKACKPSFPIERS